MIIRVKVQGGAGSLWASVGWTGGCGDGGGGRSAGRPVGCDIMSQ